MRILLVEDDEILGDGIVAGLREFSYASDWIRTGKEFESALLATEYDLIILDLNLPDGAGLKLLEDFRDSGKTTPVLILTAYDSREDKVRGLDHGADDYMVKPFDLDELAARIRALIRRSHGRAHPLLQHGSLVMDTAQHLVTVNGINTDLSVREFTLLQMLLENAGRVLSRNKIEEKIYAWGEEIESNAVEVHIHNLRKKLGVDVIKTIRGVGYVIR